MARRKATTEEVLSAIIPQLPVTTLRFEQPLRPSWDVGDNLQIAGTSDYVTIVAIDREANALDVVELPRG